VQYPVFVLLPSIDRHSRSTRHAGDRGNAGLTGSRINPSPISHALKVRMYAHPRPGHGNTSQPRSVVRIRPSKIPLLILHLCLLFILLFHVITCIHHVPPSRASITCIHHVHPSRASITCIHHVHPSRACVLSSSHDTLDANRLLSIHFTLYHRPPPRQIGGCALAGTLFGAL
jgi:hypothetical protein